MGNFSVYDARKIFVRRWVKRDCVGRNTVGSNMIIILEYIKVIIRKT